MAKSSIAAAEGLNVATRRLQVVVDNLSLGYKAHAAEISKALTAEEKLSAFTKQDLTDSLGKLIPATHNVGQGLKDVALAADIARARNTDLATATMIVLKAQEGNVGALKRMGIAITPVKDAQNALIDSHKHFTTEIKAQAKALDAAATSHIALAQLQKTYGGNASKDTTETQKFKDELNKLQVAVGQGLLPAIDKLLPQLSSWIDKNVKTATVTRDVKAAVSDATEVFKTAKTVIGAVDTVTGGLKNTLEDIAALKLLGTLNAWTGGFRTLGSAEAIGGAETAASGLLGTLGRLKGLGPIGLIVSLNMVRSNSMGQSELDKLGLGFLGKIPIIGNAEQQLTAAGHSVGASLFPTSTKGMTPAQIVAAAGRSGQIDMTTGLPLPGNANPTNTYKRLAAASATQYGLPTGLFLAQINQESGFNPNARSKAGAKGIAQFMDGTMGSGTKFNPFNPTQALPEAAKMMAGLVAHYNGDYGLALAAYNAGSGRVDQFLAGKASLPLETQNYVRSITGAAVSGYGTLPTPTATPAAIAALVAQGTTKAKKVHTISGLKLLPASIQIALDKAMGTKGLGDDTSALRNAITFLQHDTSGGKLEVAHELGVLQKQLNSVDKAIAAQVKAKHQALLTEIQKIKSSYSTQISAGKAAIGTAFSQIQTDLDTAFQAQTQAYIDKVLGPKYHQGSLTPLEAKLAAMQTADKNQSLQDTLDAAKKQLGLDQNGSPLQSIYDDATGKTSTIYSGAGPADQIALDQKAVDAAQRAIDEDKLATEATAERAQADKDYAAAVTRYQADRTEQERQLNVTLAQFGKGLQDGSVSIGQLSSFIAPFGVSLTDVPTGQLTFDMDNLSTAVQALSLVMAQEAVALSGVNSAAAQSLVQKIVGGDQNLRQLPGGVIAQNSVIGRGFGGAFGMAAGGIYTGPTVIGEAGKEAVIPLESPRALSMIAGALGRGDTVVHNVIQLDGRTVFENMRKHATRDLLNGGTGLPGKTR